MPLNIDFWLDLANPSNDQPPPSSNMLRRKTAHGHHGYPSPSTNGPCTSTNQTTSLIQSRPLGKYENREKSTYGLPRALMRSYTNHQIKERRSKSQPSYGNEVDESDDEERAPAHVSRIDRFSVDSTVATTSQDSGIRSSTHSGSSATTSTISSHEETPQRMLLVEAVWDHVAMLADELPFATGDIVTVLDCTSNSGLWHGVCRNRTGWFPASYVRVIQGDYNHLSSSSISSSEEFPDSMRKLRRKVIEELMETERDYVTLLQNLVQGFIEQCRRRKELFSEERIRRIFGNIEQIALLHCKLLRELEVYFDEETPENSCVANAFLRNSQSFVIYTEYCNNRPVSCAELATLGKDPQYHQFFEACRLLRGMVKLNLEGFLLTPVQRICRYPLQLWELLKATPPGHLDRMPLEQAHRTMREVAAAINDAKRRVDGIQKIILWQRNVIGFRGPDLIDNNHRMLISGEMYCRAIMRGVVQWSKTVHVYLFDQSIVLCKKDVLKKSAMVFKERMSLQSVTVVDLPDGKDPTINTSLKNSFKMTGPTREYIFTCPDPATKGLWMENCQNRPRPMPPTNAEKRLAIITLTA